MAVSKRYPFNEQLLPGIEMLRSLQKYVTIDNYSPVNSTEVLHDPNASIWSERFDVICVGSLPKMTC